MIMGQAMQHNEYYEERVKEYKNDTFIKGCLKIIERVLAYAKPSIMIKIGGDLKDSSFDIDEKSKKDIAYWQKIIEDYIEKNYSDIIRKPE